MARRGLIALAMIAIYSQPVVAKLAFPGPPGTSQFIYDYESGNLSFRTPAVWNPAFSVEISSNSALFMTDGHLPDPRFPFDTFSETVIFHLDPLRFHEYDFGRVLPANVSGSYLSNDLSAASGCLAGCGGYSLTVVPEPNGDAMLGCVAVLSLYFFPRTRTRDASNRSLAISPLKCRLFLHRHKR